MVTKVAVVPINQDYPAALRRAVALIGGIDDLNQPEREVTVKIGLFDPRQRHHVTLETLGEIIAVFDRAPCVHLAESDNYCGEALPRLERFRPLFSERAVPASLTGDPQARRVTLAGEEMALSPLLFKPNVFISTHVLRTFTRGSILKNLFGCTPVVQRSKYHKNEIFARQIADLFEAAGGIDLGVLDGTDLFLGASDKRVPMGVLAVSRDALALEVVGMTLAGVKPEKNPVIQEFARRGLGESDLKRIEIVGVTPAELSALHRQRRELKKLIDAEPRLPGVSSTIDTLVSEGWFDINRCAPEVVSVLQERGVSNATLALVEATLRRRAGKNLERVKEGAAEGQARGAPWLYRRKEE
jgi:hypothetical protein